MKKLLFVLSLGIIFCGCTITCGCAITCPNMSNFLQKLETYDRARPNDIMRVKVFSFPLPNDVIGSVEELNPYGELIEKWINESDECGRVIAIVLAIDGIRDGEDFRRLVFSLFYEPKELTEEEDEEYFKPDSESKEYEL